ncbi:hypothetical protein PGB90_001096 [Kerria lacca]
MWKTVIGSLQVWHCGLGFCVYRYSCVSLVCSVLIRLRTTASRRDVSDTECMELEVMNWLSVVKRSTASFQERAFTSLSASLTGVISSCMGD